MNIIEAIKSGKRFRRPGTPWIETAGSGRRILRALHPEGPEDYWPDNFDIVADDWEIQEPMVVITRKMFWSAYAKALKPLGQGSLRDPIGEVVGEMAEELGLSK